MMRGRHWAWGERRGRETMWFESGAMPGARGWAQIDGEGTYVRKPQYAWVKDCYGSNTAYIKLLTVVSCFGPLHIQKRSKWTIQPSPIPGAVILLVSWWAQGILHFHWDFLVVLTLTLFDGYYSLQNDTRIKSWGCFKILWSLAFQRALKFYNFDLVELR